MGSSHEQSLGIASPNSIRHHPIGDQAIVLSFGDKLSEAVNTQVRKVVVTIENYIFVRGNIRKAFQCWSRFKLYKCITNFTHFLTRIR